jgi:hypothetical protein
LEEFGCELVASLEDQPERLWTPAFVYCALEVVKTPNDEWDLPPIGKTAGRG